MREKDLTEKILEDYNDVFADIINVLVFNGERRIDPSALKNAQTISQYKDDQSMLHEQERDVAKYWIDCNIEIAVCGIENQTKAEKLMPLRVMGYEGASYRSDFKVVANFFAKKRKYKDYIPDDHTVIRHIDEVLKLLSVMSGDDQYEKTLEGVNKEVRSMCDVAQRLVDKGRTEGRAESYFEMVQEGICPVHLAAQNLKMSEPEFEKRMEAAGYKVPDLV